MSLLDILRLFRKHWKLLAAVPLALGSALFYFTRNQEKLYASESTIYTGIASGYSLTGNAETNFFTTTNAFDNLLSLIKARDTREEVAYWLIASHIQLKELDVSRLNWNSLVRLRELLPAALRQKLVGPTLEVTKRNVAAYAKANDTNEIYLLLNSHDPIYSLEALGHLIVSRIGTSDLIKIEYEAPDAAICRHTLQLTTQVFMAEYRGLRIDQTAAVIRYYEAETARALRQLNAAEEKFLVFNRDNNIINYYEQTKFIAGEREYLYSDINKIEMQFAAATAALGAADKKLAGRGAALLSSGALLEKRRQLEEINAQIADQQLFDQQHEAGSVSRIPQLQEQAAETIQGIRTMLADHYAQVNSVDGIPSRGLVEEWVKNLLEATRNKAMLHVMDKRKGDFMEEYHKMAPLGATLKRIEREIDLTQKTYLSLLTSLNNSKASQQNNQLTTNLKIVDPAFLPLQAKAGKRLAMVGGGAFGGFFFVAAIILAMGLTDRSLRKPSITTLQTGLPVLGVRPPLPLTNSDPTGYDRRSLDQLARQLLRKVSAAGTAAPFVVGVLSPRSAEGKTALLRDLAARCNEMGLTTRALYPTGSAAGPETDDIHYYDADLATTHRLGLAELAPLAAGSPQLILMEFPALIEAIYPVALLPELQSILFTLRAHRRWEPTDQHALADLRAATAAPIEIVLMGVELADSKEILV